MKYFIYDEVGQKGPFSLEELKELKIKKSTPIWFQGLEDWREAYSIEEIKSILEDVASPPPFNNKSTFSENVPPFNSSEVYSRERSTSKNKVVGWVLLGATLIIALLSFNYFGAEDGTSDSILQRKKSPEELRAELKRNELATPLNYLHVDYSLSSNLIGKSVIKGQINSTATMATFKDALIGIKYYTGTKTLLREDEQRIYEYIGPRKSVSFKIKEYAPRDCEYIDVVVKRAKPVY